jgi:hypothetical protein
MSRSPKQHAEGEAVAEALPVADEAGKAAVPRGAPAPAGSVATRAGRERLIVDDGEPATPSQMGRAIFMAKLRAQLQPACDEELAAVGRTAQGCPVLQAWLRHYDGQNAASIERALRRYSGAAPTDAAGLIAAIVGRVRSAIRGWATTGSLSSVPHPAPDEGMPLAVQASGMAGAVTPGSDPAAVRDQLGPGRALEQSTRMRMESAYGHSFTEVRVHDDEGAARLSSQLSARAFTVGSDIAFGESQYRPSTPVGELLIAHELAHTIQQRGGAGAPGSNSSALEHDADRAAAGAVGRSLGFAAPVPSSPGGLRLQRCGPPPYSKHGPHHTFEPSELMKRIAHWKRAGLLNPDNPRVRRGPKATRVARWKPFPVLPFDLEPSQEDIEQRLGPRVPTAAAGLGVAGLGMMMGPGAGFEPPPPGMFPGPEGMAGEEAAAEEALAEETLAEEAGGEVLFDATAEAGTEALAETAVEETMAEELLAEVGGEAVVPGAGLLLAAATVGGAAIVLDTAGLGPDPLYDDPITERPVESSQEWEWYEKLTEDQIARLRELEGTSEQVGPDVDVDVDEDEDEEEQRRPTPWLHLPMAKQPNLDRYEAKVTMGELVADPAYSRKIPTTPRQAQKWRDEMDPGQPSGIDPQLFEVGVDALMNEQGESRFQAERRVLLPDWSKTRLNQRMTVDHVLELQLLLPQDRGWSDGIGNYELLDASANSSSGIRLYNNVKWERERLFRETGAVGYLTQPLEFEMVDVNEGDGPLGEHWTVEEVRSGQHVEALLQLLGIPDAPRRRHHRP